ncbi:ABC transporter permease [Leptospira ryugenii]|uniref:ABC transporter permease n=1 Tax=Leptospira ryugenii TaxID=1917863 RepID=A0A2P2DZJ2_9LEPT|nr:MFS transporter [Leptospira ryugenii]GBF50051.1 ABC transporter permease [Leptospira ryugenii]
MTHDLSPERKKSRNLQIFGWCMFDFANSSYTTVIISVVYCEIFTQLIVPSDPNSVNPFQHGNSLWAWALAISYLFVVLTGPLFGAITDYSSTKKLFLFLSYVGCVVATFALYYVNPGMIWLGFVLVAISNFFFASGENFASSFLPFLGEKEDLGKISGYAWGIGYFGGIGSVVLATTLGDYTLSNFENLKLVGPYTAVFFMLAAIPTFIFLKEPKLPMGHPSNISFLKEGIRRVVTTLKDASHFRDLMVYLVSLFFTMAALAIVISFAFIYGSQEIHIEAQHKQVMFIFIQISAALGALAFGVIQDNIGAKKTFNLTLVLWLAVCGLIYIVADLTQFFNSVLGTSWTVQWVFVAISSLAGMGLGSTQSASRAMVGIFSPESKSGEFFGMWGLSGKIAAAAGLFLFGFIQTIVSLKNAFLVVALFYLISLLINLLVDEERGIKAAQEFKE